MSSEGMTMSIDGALRYENYNSAHISRGDVQTLRDWVAQVVITISNIGMAEVYCMVMSV
jgi:hypothetical protein